MIEILAPAGSSEQMIAAVRCGADAVYLGAKNFNARRNADNFEENSLEEAVSYCHSRNVKVYITLNTIIKDSELSELKDTIREIASYGVDGVLVQDLAAYRMIKNMYPDMPLHASTQMAVHNVNGAKILEEMGFSRIVLAREMSFEEIRAVCNSVSCEVEVFVHGAHCMSASGLCYMSSTLGQRSGNRGLCAQPCRLNWEYKGRDYALSLKDMCLVDEVEKLIEAGVNSLKIEGRMKRPEYVAATVDAYRKAIENKPYSKEDLQNVFSRSGFTKGFFTAKRNLTMFGYRTKDDVINMNSSLSHLRNLYKSEIQKINVDMMFTATADSSELRISDGNNEITVNGNKPQKSERVSLSDEMAKKSLIKTGGTIYNVKTINTDIAAGIIMPASDINNMRRQALEQLDEKRNKLNGYREYSYEDKLTASIHEIKDLRFRFTSISQLPDSIPGSVILPVEEITEKEILRFGKSLIASLPTLIYPYDEGAIREKLLKLKASGLEKAQAENISQIKIINDCGLECCGGHCLNILNSLACDEYIRLGCKDITLSTENSFSDIRRLRTPAKYGIIVYGNMPLMHFRCCPMQRTDGCGNCSGNNKITDRIGKEFPVICRNKRYSVLYNCVPLYADSDLPPADFITLYFTTETKQQCNEIIQCFTDHKSFKGEKTLGLYNKILL